MNWTKRHSQNAVAARARRRMAPLEPPDSKEESLAVFKPRRRRARFTIQIRDHVVGDSLTLNLRAAPWPNRWLCEQGEFSSAKLGRVSTLILQGGSTS